MNGGEKKKCIEQSETPIKLKVRFNSIAIELHTIVVVVVDTVVVVVAVASVGDWDVMLRYIQKPNIFPSIRCQSGKSYIVKPLLTRFYPHALSQPTNTTYSTHEPTFIV